MSKETSWLSTHQFGGPIGEAMGLGDWLRHCFGIGGTSTDLCERCSGLLAPAARSHLEVRASDASRAVAAHTRLVRRAWRSSYPQEGGEDLYQCRDCRSWWGHSVWTCVPQEDLFRRKVRSIEAWVKEQHFGDIIQ
jgi:hypothetical protein